MLSFTSAQLDAWLALYLYPLTRVLALLAAAPVLSNRAMPTRVRLAAGLAITIAVAPLLPAVQAAPVGSWDAVLEVARQLAIGAAMGFSIRLVFAAVDIMGEVIGLQMGLSFAQFFDPTSPGQSAVLTQFLTLIASLVFLAINGHLLLLDVLVRSFEMLPVGRSVAPEGWLALVRSAALMFAVGLLMALPAVAALLITSVALGILTRTAPQLNLLAIGFPITFTIGFGVLLLILDAYAPMLQYLFDRGVDGLGLLLRQP